MNDHVAQAVARLPTLLADHVLLSAAALALGLLLSVPLGVVAAGRPRLARVLLGIAATIQTIPGLALLALFYPFLLALSAFVGGGIPALGFLPSLLALSLYAVLPILRNVVAGITGIDPAVIEAADGVGMTVRQKLLLVEAPLAAPVAMAGIRTAAVWTIGAATLSTTVGQPSLGDLIFAGLQTQDIALVLVGCIAAAALALIVDALLGLVEHAITRRRRGRALIAAGLIALGLAAAIVPALLPRAPGVTIGAKNFSEQYILARLIGQRLEAAGYRVSYKEGLGSAVAFAALAAGDVDVYVDYSGTIWNNAMKRADNPSRAAMLAEVGRWARAEHDVALVGSLGFENAYAIAMRGADAKRLGVTSITDLARVAPDLVLGTDIEFPEGPEWRSIREAYRLRFKAQQAYSPSFMYRALASGQADAISAFSSDGRIAADRLTVLTDPRHAIPNYDAILLVAPARADDVRFVGALRQLVGAIPVEAMRAANYQVDRDVDKRTPEAAADWLARRIGQR